MFTETSQMTPDVATVDETSQRTSRIERIREQIAAGTYLTDDKLDWVVDVLWTELRKPRATRRVG